MMRNILIFLITSFAITAFLPDANAQNAPITYCGSSQGTPGNTVDVAVTVVNFTNIGATSLTLDYPFDVIQFVEGNSHPDLYFIFGDSDLGNGTHRIAMSWFGSSTNLPDNDTLLVLTFDYTAGNATLSWHDDGSSCEYADGNYMALNDIPTEDYYFNGYVCGGVPAPGTIYGSVMVCAGEEEVSYSIDMLANATGYFWTVPEGAIIVNGQYTIAITVDYSDMAVSGFVEVYGYNSCGDGPPSQLAVTVNELPIADAGDDFSINYGTSTTLSAAPGGTGTYSYHWSPEELLVDPMVQNPQTVILTSTTIFTVVVTDLATGCDNSDEVTVTITGGPLNVNPVAVPNVICRGDSSQLFANAGGGSGSYTYEWSCIPAGSPPWSSNQANPIVAPDSATQYVVIIEDGFTNVIGSAFLMVNPLPTATLSGGDTLCGTGNNTELTVDLTGTPPWNFIYTFGGTSVNIFNVTTTPYIITTGSPGVYNITYVEDVNCSGTASGSAVVNVFPVPATPEITINGTQLTSSACCGNQWHLDGDPIPGATEQTYIAQVSGDYFTIVTLNGCSSDTSEVVDIIVGIEDNSETQFSAYPVPAGEKIYVEMKSGQGKDMQARIRNIHGQTMKYFRFIGSSERNEVDLKGLAPGMYILQLDISGRIYHQKIIVN